MYKNYQTFRQICLPTEIPHDVAVKDLPTFVEVRGLSNESSCMSGMAFGGQADDLLDTSAKQDTFAATLDADAQAFFDRLRNSPGDYCDMFITIMC